MAAGELADYQRICFAREMCAKERLEPRDIDLFSWANCGCLIPKVNHIYFLISLLPIRQQSGIVQMLKRVECAQREAIRRKQKFAVRTIAGHPGHLQGVLWRKAQSALHGNGDRPAGSENGAGFAFAGSGEEFGEPAMNAGEERFPGFDAVDGQLPLDPHGDNSIKEFLKVSAALRRAVCSFNGSLEIANLRIGLG